MLDPRLVNFRPLTMADLSLEHHWLNHTPEVRDFCAEGKETAYEQVVAKYGPRIRGESPTRCFIIQYGETPIGHIQTYRWQDYPDYARHLDLTEEAAGLDVWIGRADYLHKGLGRHILQAFLREVVFADPDLQSCVITPEVRNASALRAYAKAGFVNLRTIEHPDEPGPVCVLRIGRGAVAGVQPRAYYLTDPSVRRRCARSTTPPH